VGDRVDEGALRAFLARMGFSQVADGGRTGRLCDARRHRRHLAAGEPGPVRLDFFGDVLDGARRFDPETQRTTEKLGSVDLAPVSEIVLDEAAITRFRQNYRAEFGAGGADDPLV
jgi:transcription-repair coupling factor (superfamily II helicase)